ncbi:hypothetical protein RCO28_38010 [Streptomyces sp. LHD-70]|uniref:hypothetical protein n=1 Tax=Streptomyces sp. LHD-70 TaxID=3072140 RepID=UPI00281073BF|nr:hypothetical protein [Streptomyces sp. LHD-70]MDQ8708214.1 hypothetical protein [Streptomyces sp. LHD-70]
MALNCYGKGLAVKDGVLDVKGPVNARWPLKSPQNIANGLRLDDGGGMWVHDYQLRGMRPKQQAPDDERLMIPGAGVTGANRYWTSPVYRWDVRNEDPGADLIVNGSCWMRGVHRGLPNNGWVEPLAWARETAPPAEGSKWDRISGDRVSFGNQIYWSVTIPFQLVIASGGTASLHRAVGAWVQTGYDWPIGTGSYADLTCTVRATGFLTQPRPTGQGGLPTNGQP